MNLLKCKGIPAILVLGAFMIGLTGCSIKGGSSVANSNPVKTVVAQGEINTYYASLADLQKAASDIIECTVNSSETIVYADMPFTISQVKISEVQKGKHKTGDVVKIIETGGVYRPLDKNSKPSGQQVDYQFDGIPVMKPGEHLLLFLHAFDGPQVSGAYVPLGVYQGKFKIVNSSVIQQAPDQSKIKDLSNLNQNDFINKLKQKS